MRHTSARAGRLTIALALSLSLLWGCVTPPISEEIAGLPTEPIHVTAQSVRPIERSSADGPRVAPVRRVPLVTAPGLMAALTPVYATAETDLPSDVLEPRLADLCAQEQVRLRLLTEGMEQMALWGKTSLAPSPPLQGTEAIARLSEGIQITSQGHRVEGRLVWSALVSDAAGETGTPGHSAAPPETQGDVRPLDARTRRLMQAEAEGRALNRLENILLDIEVGDGQRLQGWMEQEGIEQERLERVLDRAETERVEFTLDEIGGQHICELELVFDPHDLNRLSR
ncbi:hypothetical protein JXA47_02670 [Candidatus Sumerlaeota bacterium]|nr:hypothetical protein [Candidatus Sumerlaeota bacterium]